MKLLVVIITLNLLIGMKTFSMKALIPSILYRKNTSQVESGKFKLIKKLEILDKKLGIYIFTKETKATESIAKGKAK